MKTNHQRGFVAKTHRDSAMFCTGATAPLSDRRIGASIGNDFTDGNRGMAKAKHGAKKFVRTRTRFHENAATKRLARELSE
jgi:hypothetical protein